MLHYKKRTTEKNGRRSKQKLAHFWEKVAKRVVQEFTVSSNLEAAEQERDTYEKFAKQ